MKDLPDWVVEAYFHDPVVHQMIRKARQANLTSEKLAWQLARILYQRGHAWQQLAEKIAKHQTKLLVI